MHPTWKDKISNPAQLGGIETSVLDNGPGRGTRIAWMNTGSGLRYKVVIDRSMDIADAFYNAHSLAWLSHTGITTAQPLCNSGLHWLQTFNGGLLTTCGLTHVGGPETDEYGSRGLHDQISNLPATIESIVQPNPAAGKMDMSITGLIKQTQALGPNLELRRTISSTLGENRIRIHDVVTNCGNTPSPHMLLYHFNLGWPLVDEGSEIFWNGTWQPREQGDLNNIFKEGNSYKKIPAPLASHSGRGEEAAFINAAADENGKCTCGIYNSALGIALSLCFKKEQLPWLTNWQHFGKGEFVTGLEPGTNRVIGQSKARAQNELIFLEPSEKKEYQLELEVIGDSIKINDLLK